MAHLRIYRYRASVKAPMEHGKAKSASAAMAVPNMRGDMHTYTILTMVPPFGHVRPMTDAAVGNERERRHFSLSPKISPVAKLTQKKKTSTAPSKAGPGRAARALKEMRIKVYHVIPGEKLTLAQMAKECKMLGADGKPSASSYQYTEERVGDFFPLDVVNTVIPPLSRRGVPVAEIKRRLLGEISQVVANASPVVPSPSDSGTRKVPVVTRESALRILMGEFDIQQIVDAPTADEQWGMQGVVIGWESVPGASDKTIMFHVLDGSRSQIAVDPGDRMLVDGKSYVWTVDGKSMFFSRWSRGVMIAREGSEFGNVLPFDAEACQILGRVIKLITDE